MVDASAKKDISEASVYEEYTLPKFYAKVQYCISCAVHAHIIRVRNHEVRRNRGNTKKRLTAEEKEEQIRQARRRMARQKAEAEGKAVPEEKGIAVAPAGPSEPAPVPAEVAPAVVKA